MLLQDYNCEIGACLLQLKERQDSAVQARMQVLTFEALSLTGRTMLNPANHRAIVNARLDDATPVAQKPGKAFYQGLLVGCLLCIMQTVLERQDLSHTYLAHHELASEFIIVIIGMQSLAAQPAFYLASTTDFSSIA